MVKKLVLNDKIYNITSKERRKNIFLRYSKYLNVKTQGFSNTKVKIKKLRSFDNRFEVEIFGPEELFIYNLLKKDGERRLERLGNVLLDAINLATKNRTLEP